MKRCFLFGLLILTFVISGNAQKLIYGGKPKLFESKGGTKAYTVKFPDGTFIYKFDNQTDEDSHFQIGKGRNNLGKIDASVNSSGADIENFHTFYGDLDNNKSAELVVVDFNGQSNGLGVKYFTINIFRDFQTKGFTEPLSFTDYEFGAKGTFIYDAAKGETLILLTEFLDSDKIDVKRGSGLYLIGKYFRYQDGMLKPAYDKPILARRYLNSFETERWKTINDPRVPYLWFNSPATHKLNADPEFLNKPASSQTGVIEKFEKLAEKYKRDEDSEAQNVEIEQITVKFDSGETKTIVLSKRDELPELESIKNKILPDTFGILPMKFSLPSYLNPVLSLQNFEGKKVQLDTYKLDADSEPYYKLWFIEK